MKISFDNDFSHFWPSQPPCPMVSLNMMTASLVLRLLSGMSAGVTATTIARRSALAAAAASTSTAEADPRVAPGRCGSDP